MAINGIKFQNGHSLAKKYGTEEQCETAFMKTRWRRDLRYACKKADKHIGLNR